MTGRRWWTVLVTCLLLGAAAPAVASTVPRDVIAVGDEHVHFPRFTSPDGLAPMAVASGLGDVNGDGIDDVAVGLGGYGSFQGVYVVPSPPVLPSVLSAADPGWPGFRIVGQQVTAVTGLGDVNGDGRDEVAVSDGSGDVAVVFGRSDGQTVDVSQGGDWGFRISGTGSQGGHGFGTGYAGSGLVNTAMVDAGDQNGDGKPDLAVASLTGVVVAYTPKQPAGAVVDAITLADHGFRLVRPGVSNQGEVTVSRAGDLDGDGREDLVVAWDEQNPVTSRAVGAVSPSAGAVVDLGSAAANGTGWEVEAPGTYLENALSVGDQNSDGRRDVVLAAVDLDGGRLGSSRLIGYAPPLGQRTTIRPPTPATGATIDVTNGNVVDVGDQDGDGRSDLAYGDFVRHSWGGLPGVPAGSHPGGRTYLEYGSIILGSVADRNGDGKRELITVVSRPHRDFAPAEANWKLDVYSSAPTPQPIDIPPPVATAAGLNFTGTFQAGTGQASNARLSVELDPAGGSPSLVSAPNVTASRQGRVTSTLRVTPSAGHLVSGRAYDFRLLLENAWGLVGASRRQRFVYHAPAAAPQKQARHRVRGTSHADRLVGTNGPDDIYGRGGNDRLRGLHGKDRLSGGAGNDVIFARDGERDVVDCGPGRDRAIVDRKDRVGHCEHVRRR